MNLLIVCQHRPICTGRKLFTPFQRLGLDVRHIGEAVNEIGYGPVAERYHWQPQGDWQHYWPDWTPDVILYAETLHAEWRHTHYKDVPHVQYNSAGPQDKPMPKMDWTFNATSFGGLYEKTKRATWIPCGWNADWVTPSPIPWEEREYDVCFIGAVHSIRKSMLNALEAAGLKVFRASNLVYEQFREPYHNSRMGLIQHVQKTLPIRVFETPALNVLALSPTYVEHRKLPVKGYWKYDEDCLESVVNAARMALTNPELAKIVMAEGYEWAQAHSWDHRAADMLAVFKELTNGEH